jgi:alpha-beta hydrolase superfamily lysophospholipase
MATPMTHDGLALLAAVPSAPERTPVLLVHGLSGGGWMLERWADFFGARGHPAYALTLRGHLDSRPVRDLGRVTIADYADDVRDAAAMIEARHGAGPALVGHSMGGLVVQAAAARGVGRALVMVCSAPCRGVPLVNLRVLPKQMKYLPALFLSRPVKGSDAEQRELTFHRTAPEETEASLRRLVPESGTAARQAGFSLVRVDPSAIRVPVLSMGGAEDRFIPPRVARALADRYGGSCRIYERHAHNLPNEPGWEGPAGDLAAWLAARVPVSTA